MPRFIHLFSAFQNSICARRAHEAPERWLGRTYAANTTGALIGSLAAGFWMLPTLGLQRDASRRRYPLNVELEDLELAPQ